MPRERKPSARQKGERWYARIRLNDGTRYEWAIPVPAGEPPLTKGEADAYAIKMQSQYDAGKWDPRTQATQSESDACMPGAKVPTVLQLARQWATAQHHPSAAEEARLIGRHIAHAAIASMPVTEVRPRHVVEFLSWLRARPSRKGGTTAPRTMRCVYSVLQRVLQHGVMLEVINASPCVIPRSAMPALNDKVPGSRAGWVFTAAEVRTLIDDTRLDPTDRMVHALLFCAGLRAGELAALRWSDWDRDAKPLHALHVARSMERYSGDEKATKTGVVRKVPVHPRLQAKLAAWWQHGWERVHGRAPKAHDRIVPMVDSLAALTQVHLYDRFQRSLQTVELRRRRVHDTRRTFITLLRDGGARQDVVASLTHTSRRTIIDAYSSLSWDTLCREVMFLRLDDATPPSSEALNEQASETLNGGSNGGRELSQTAVPSDFRGVAWRARQDSNSFDPYRSVEFRRETQGADGRNDTERDGSGEAFPHSSPIQPPPLRWGETAAFEVLERWHLAMLNDATLLPAAPDGAVN